MLLFANYSFAQSGADSSSVKAFCDTTYRIKINPSLPEYLIHYHCNYIYIEEKEAISTEITVTVCSLSTPKMIDTIHYVILGCDPLYVTSPSFKETRPEFSDVNFDGFIDMRLLDIRGDRGDFAYCYYLFDPKERVFRINQEFSELLATGAKFDYSKKQFTTSWITNNFCEGYCWEENTYGVINNHPVLVEQVISEIGNKGKLRRRIITTKQNIGGIMKTVKTDYEEIDDK